VITQESSIAKLPSGDIPWYLYKASIDLPKFARDQRSRAYFVNM